MHFFSSFLTTLVQNVPTQQIILPILPLKTLLVKATKKNIGSTLQAVVVNIDYCTKKETTLRVGHFTTISGHFSANYTNIFHKTEVQTVILRCLVYLCLNWIKSQDIILVKNIFFSCLKCIISGLFCRSEFWHLLRKPALIFSKWLFFQNSLELS